MNTLLTRRLLQLLPMLFFISLVAFLLVKLAPGDPVAAYITPRMAPEDIERIRQSLGLDKPLVTQYVLWLKNVLQGDLGYSLIYHRPVLEMIGERIPATLGLMGASLLLAIVTLILSLLGTLIVRSGILVSVHAFALDNVRATPLFALFTVLSLASLGLYAWRGQQVRQNARFGGWSREMLILVALLLFSAATAVSSRTGRAT